MQISFLLMVAAAIAGPVNVKRYILGNDIHDGGNHSTEGRIGTVVHHIPVSPQNTQQVLSTLDTATKNLKKQMDNGFDQLESLIKKLKEQEKKNPTLNITNPYNEHKPRIGTTTENNYTVDGFKRKPAK